MPKVKTEEWWVSKLDQTLGGVKVHKGQLCRPAGNRNDHLVFIDLGSRWVSRFDGKLSDGQPCGTDGCDAVFSNLGSLERHRQIAHAPDREYRARRIEEERQFRREAEERGESYGGLPVERIKQGPGGPVPYVKPGIG